MIEIRNVSKTFHLKDQTIAAVKDVSLKIGDGDIYGVIGYSGAGKSTLVRCLNFLEIPDEGQITFSGFGTYTARNGVLYHTADGQTATVDNQHPVKESDLKDLRKHVGMIFQHFNLLDRSTVYENVAFPLKHSGKTKQEIHDKVFEELRLVGLSDRADSYPSELSGGQKQRVAIARALAMDPRILLSDEATSALDPDVTESILELLEDLNRKLGLTIILITHEMAVIKNICDRVAVMDGGSVVEEGPVYSIFSTPVEPITKRFVSASSGFANLDRLLKEDSSLVSTTSDSRLLRLLFDTECVGDAMISDVSRRYHVDLNIVLANVELLQDKPLGRMVVKIKGNPDGISAAIDFMRQCKVKVEVLNND